MYGEVYIYQVTDSGCYILINRYFRLQTFPREEETTQSTKERKKGEPNEKP